MSLLSHFLTQLYFQSHLAETSPEDERGLMSADDDQTFRNVSGDSIFCGCTLERNKS